MATKKTTPKKKVATKKKCSLTVSVNGTEQTFEHDTLLGCVQQFVKPDFVKTDILLKANVEGMKSEAVLGVFKARRTFGNGTSMVLLASDLTKRLHG